MSTVKDAVRDMLNSLPDDITWEEMEYRLHVRALIEKADREFDEGDWVSHEEAERIIDSWSE